MWSNGSLCLSCVPESFFELGEQLCAQQEDGRELHVRVMDESDDTVALDGNHPLAVKNLTFDLQLVEIG